LIAGKTPREIAQEMSRRYAGAATHVRADLSHFIAVMENRDLLIRHDRARPLSDHALPPLALDTLALDRFPALPNGVTTTSQWQHPAWLEAWARLHSVNNLLKHAGLYRLAQALVALPAQKTITATEADVHALAIVVTDVAEWAPFHAACLHQSLVLAWMLRQRHVDVDVVMGVYTHPFSAHVWLESAGHIIQWRAGMGYYADVRRLEAMSIIFHTRALPSLTGRTHV
ncbi:MAG: lasso peptide biosynthesis B2 protein, partial [Ktedonobacteraceae bacterium]|nr:lasso peptide biosynthesis B2 protein [Ktedonobacteraceae bacterium]